MDKQLFEKILNLVFSFDVKDYGANKIKLYDQINEQEVTFQSPFVSINRLDLIEVLLFAERRRKNELILRGRQEKLEEIKRALELV